MTRAATESIAFRFFAAANPGNQNFPRRAARFAAATQSLSAFNATARIWPG
jgi:hypothetical protein